MQELLFDGKDGNGKKLTEHIKGLITRKFNVTDIPDAFIFMPEQLGGLGVKNPFILTYMSRNYLKRSQKKSCELSLLKRNRNTWMLKKISKVLVIKADVDAFGRFTPKTSRWTAYSQRATLTPS
jgi:hypothetical protein